MAEIWSVKKTNSIQWVKRSEWSNPVVQGIMLAQSTSIRLSNWMIRRSAWQSFSHVEWGVWAIDEYTTYVVYSSMVWAHKAGWLRRDSLTHTHHSPCVDFDWRIYIKYRCFVLSCGVCWPTYDREEKTCKLKSVVNQNTWIKKGEKVTEKDFTCTNS